MKFYRSILIFGVIALLPHMAEAFAPAASCSAPVAVQPVGTVVKLPLSLSWSCDEPVYGYWAVVRRDNDIYFAGPMSQGGAGPVPQESRQGVLYIPTASFSRVPPKDGKVLTVDVWYQVDMGGRLEWKKKIFDYMTEGGASSVVSLTPAASSTLPSVSQLFSWTPISGATEYWVDLGTAKGKADIYSGMSANNGASPQVSITKIPQNGKPVYLRLWYQVGQGSQNWLYQDFFYNTRAPVTASTISSITPAPGDSITTTQTFTWNAVTGAKQYGIEASQVSPGGTELAYKVATNPTVTLSNINTGKNLYVRIWYQVNGVWKSQDFTYYK